MVWEKPKTQKWSGSKRSGRSKPRNGLKKGSGGGLSPTVLQGGRVAPASSWWGLGLHEQRSLGGARLHQQRSLGGARLHQQKVLGLGSLPLTLKGSTALTASVGLTSPWSIQQPQLYLGCTFSVLRSLAKLGRLRALKCW